MGRQSEDVVKTGIYNGLDLFFLTSRTVQCQVDDCFSVCCNNPFYHGCFTKNPPPNLTVEG